MPVSKAQLKATAKYEKENYFKYQVRFKKDFENELRKYCGASMNAFIIDAVVEKIERIKAEKLNDNE